MFYFIKTGRRGFSIEAHDQRHQEMLRSNCTSSIFLKYSASWNIHTAFHEKESVETQ
jgi:hypothetical protein